MTRPESSSIPSILYLPRIIINVVLFPHFVLNIEQVLILLFLIMQTFYSTVSCRGLSIIVLITILLDMGIVPINRYMLYRNMCANNTQLENTVN